MEEEGLLHVCTIFIHVEYNQLRTHTHAELVSSLSSKTTDIKMEVFLGLEFIC